MANRRKRATPASTAMALLAAASLLGACGGTSSRTTRSHGTRYIVPPLHGHDTVGVAAPEIERPGRKTTPAEARRLMEQSIRWVDKHCPCEFEETSAGPRLLSQRHP
jgi:hypothetical protein